MFLRLCKHYAAATGSDEDKAIREEGGALGSASDTSHTFPCPDHLALDVFGTRGTGLSSIGMRVVRTYSSGSVG
ncbi:hypothetical protein M404DRAFT_876466 [Pisolithus tinctorius Marx 270]|uniref:Uncharacterized protein n=1 Tax=Pisolithus tinctorius Marx 270 TaxID=870435 RepID=A0A0C3PQJ5_PISTI|nr:hypothetical protein M404DRAFT_876466 [Pisolithus tinctorius Marx 270]